MGLSASPSPPAPLSQGEGSLLYPYQRRWIEDRSRFKIGMFARQTGKTFSTTLEIVLDSLANKRRWVILSRGERQAKEAMDEGVKRHLLAIGQVFESLEYPFDTQIKALEVSLPNGSRITALPANPDTARGFSASVFLDEFAFHADSRKIWQALFPVISAGHQLRVVSTPNGKGNKFYDLMTAGDLAWSRHVVDIYQAVREGLPRNVEELRDALNDPDAWAQEFELQWLDEATAWLPYELIAGCEVPSPPAPLPEGEGRTAGDCYAGWDVARRRDLSVMWVVAREGDTFRTVEVVALRRESVEVQVNSFLELLQRYGVRRACVDQTGMGEPIVEQLQKRLGATVEGVLFTNSVKQSLATVLKQKFEDRQVRIPAEREIRDSLHAVKKLTTVAGNVRFDAERTDAGHADYFWALALAIHAAGTGGIVSGEVEAESREWKELDEYARFSLAGW